MEVGIVLEVTNDLRLRVNLVTRESVDLWGVIDETMYAQVYALV